MPKEANFTPTIQALFKEKTGSEAGPAEYFGFESRGVGFRPLKEQPDFSKYLEGAPEGTEIRGECGNMQVAGSFYHFTRRVFPMRNLTTVAEVEAHPWPDHTPAYRWEHLKGDVERLHAQG